MTRIPLYHSLRHLVCVILLNFSVAWAVPEHDGVRSCPKTFRFPPPSREADLREFLSPYPDKLDINCIRLATKSKPMQLVSKIPSERCESTKGGTICYYKPKGEQKGYRDLYCSVFISGSNFEDPPDWRISQNTAFALSGHPPVANDTLLGFSAGSSEKRGRDEIRCRASSGGYYSGHYLATPLWFFNSVFSVSYYDKERPLKGGFEEVPYPNPLKYHGLEIRTQGKPTQLVTKEASSRCSRSELYTFCHYEVNARIWELDNLFCTFQFYSSEVMIESVPPGASFTLSGKISNEALTGVFKSSDLGQEVNGRLHCGAEKEIGFSGFPNKVFAPVPRMFFDSLFSVRTELRDE